MQPQLQINFYAIIVAVLISFVFGWIWFGPLFGTDQPAYVYGFYAAFPTISRYSDKKKL